MTTMTSRPTETGAPSSAPQELDEAGGPAWRLVAVREIFVKLTDRNFLISTVVTLALIAGILGAQAWLGNRAQATTIAVVDDRGSQIVQAASRAASSHDTTVTIQPTTVPSAQAGEPAVRDGTADALLTGGADGWRLTFARDADAAVTQEVTSSVRAADQRWHADHGTAGRAGRRECRLPHVPRLHLRHAVLHRGPDVRPADRAERHRGEAVPRRRDPRHGHSDPVAAAGQGARKHRHRLGQMTLYAAVGLVGLSFTDYAGLLPTVAGAIGWFLAFFLAGFLALATVWAAAGALATRSEDLQSTSTPLTMVLVAAFLLGMTLSGTAKVVASFVPILSAILMPGRIAAAEAAWWEPPVALALTVAFAALSVIVGARLYRNSLLQTYKRLGVRAAWRHEA